MIHNDLGDNLSHLVKPLTSSLFLSPLSFGCKVRLSLARFLWQDQQLNSHQQQPVLLVYLLDILEALGHKSLGSYKAQGEDAWALRHRLQDGTILGQTPDLPSL